MKIFLSFLMFVSCAMGAEVNTLTDEEKKAGWVLLFDGKSAENFRNFKKEGLSPKWVVKDGALS